MRLLSRECQATGQPRSHFPVPAWQRRQQQLHQGEKQQGEQQQQEQQQEGEEEECVTNGNESHEAHQGAMAAGQDVGCGSTAARCNECSLEDHNVSQIVILSSFPPLVFDLSSCELLLSHYSPLVHSPPALPGALSCSTLSRFPTTHPSAAPLQASVLRLTLTSAASASLCHAWNSTDASMFAANRWCKVKRRRVAWQSKHAEQGKAHTCCLGGMSLQASGDSRDTRGKGEGEREGVESLVIATLISPLLPPLLPFLPAGLLSESLSLLSAGLLPDSLPATRAIGYRQVRGGRHWRGGSRITHRVGEGEMRGR